MMGLRGDTTIGELAAWLQQNDMAITITSNGDLRGDPDGRAVRCGLQRRGLNSYGGQFSECVGYGSNWLSALTDAISRAERGASDD